MGAITELGQTGRRPEDLALWHRNHQEAALEPELPIIDCHHHLWVTRRNPYTVPEFTADITDRLNVRATVHIECSNMYRKDGPEALSPVGETEFVNGMAETAASGAYGDTAVGAGIVGFADLRLGAGVREVLEAHIAAAPRRFRGIRNRAARDESVPGLDHAPAGLMQDEHFLEGFAELAPLGLSYDALVHFPQMGEVAALARRFPDTTIILDHLGGLLGIGPYEGRQQEVFTRWRASVRELAGIPNLYMKIGGMGMRWCGSPFMIEAAPPDSVQLCVAWKPYIEECVEAFGPSRCMFESNFPIDKQTSGYVPLWNAFKRATAGYRPEERAALFHDTARHVYRLDI